MENNFDFSKYCDDTAVLLVSHGSSLPYAKETFNDICAKFSSFTGLNTEVGYMKVAEPLLPDAINLLKDANPNLKRIIALPVFLAAGIHTNIDIPIILGLEPKEQDPRQPDGIYPEGHYLYGLEDIDFDGELNYLGPIGPNPRLLEIIGKRINDALEESKLNDDAKTGVLLVSHGSRLGYNKEFISSLYSLFADKFDYPSNFGFMELVEPNIPSSINKLVNENDIDRLVVIPVFLAPGVHTTRDIPTILGLIESDGNEHHHSHEHSPSHDHEHSHSHGHHHHHHSHGDEKMEFDGEVLYPEPICDEDILIEILAQMIYDSLE